MVFRDFSPIFFPFSLSLIWDPAGQGIRKLAREGLIMKQPTRIHTRVRVRLNNAAKRKGRHTGHGKRRGTAEARMPTKVRFFDSGCGGGF
jgi:ribosomal protein L19E